MKKTNSNYIPLIIASLITGIAMFVLFFIIEKEPFLSIGPLQYIVPGLSYGLGLFFVFSKMRRGSEKYIFKAMLLILFSVFGYIAAFYVTMFASIIPFLGSLLGCLSGSIILAIGLESSFGKMSKKEFRTIMWTGGILGAVLCIPTTIVMENSFMNTSPNMMYYLFPVVVWQFIMSFIIINIINDVDKDKANQSTMNQEN